MEAERGQVSHCHGAKRGVFRITLAPIYLLGMDAGRLLDGGK